MSNARARRATARPIRPYPTMPSVVPALTLFHFRRDALVTRPLPVPGLRRHLYLIRRREGGLSVAAQTLHDLIVRRLGDLKLD